MNLTVATIKNPQVGQSFKLESQEWIIVSVYDFSNNPELKKFMNERQGINASLTIKRPNGKVLYSVPHSTKSQIWEYEITRA